MTVSTNLTSLAIAFLSILTIGAEEAPAETEHNERGVFQENVSDVGVQQRMEIQRMLERRIEGEFAFEVIDQDGLPVSGVGIIFEAKSIKKSAIEAIAAGLPFGGSWLDTERIALTTDANGVGHTKRVKANHGLSARIDGENLDSTFTISEKQNYWTENPDNPGFIAKTQPHTTRPGITYIFRVIKHAKPEQLRQFEISQRHPGDGTTWYMGIFGSRWAKEAPVDGSWRPDFAVTAFRDPGAPLRIRGADGIFSGPELWQGDWNYEITAIDGGLVTDLNPLIQSAPKDEYKSSYAWSRKGNQPGATARSQQSWWWCRSGRPDKYTRLKIELGVNEYIGIIECRFQGFVNPTGGSLIILPTRETPSNMNWVKWMTEDVSKTLRNDPLGQTPVVPQVHNESP